MLHYLTDGTVKMMFNFRKELFFVPMMMILKSLVDVTDEYIYNKCIAGYEDDLFMKSCITDMLRDLHQMGVHSHYQAKQYIGKRFQQRVLHLIGPWGTDVEICEYLIKYVTVISI